MLGTTGTEQSISSGALSTHKASGHTCGRLAAPFSHCFGREERTVSSKGRVLDLLGSAGNLYFTPWASVFLSVGVYVGSSQAIPRHRVSQC